MKKLWWWSAIVGVALTSSATASAKGLIVSGTFEGTDSRGHAVSLTLRAVNPASGGSTITVITDCKLDDDVYPQGCEALPRTQIAISGAHGVEKLTILDLFTTDETYEGATNRFVAT